MRACDVCVQIYIHTVHMHQKFEMKYSVRSFKFYYISNVVFLTNIDITNIKDFNGYNDHFQAPFVFDWCFQ